MKILVCGSEGRVMSAVIPCLLEAGHDIIGVDTCEKWGVRHVSRPYRFVQGDCSDPAVVRPLIEGAEGVIQAAATLFGVVGFHRRGADILTNDLAVHQNVLRLSVAAGVARVVYLSSSIVYEQCLEEPHREEDADSAPIPRTDYGLSKVAGERLSRAYWKQYGLPYTIWRPFNVIDPAEDGSKDAGVSHVFADLIHRLIVLQQNPIEILGDGNQVRSFVHMREIGLPIAQFSFDDRTRNQAYNLGRNEVVSIRDLAHNIYRKACIRGLINNPRPLAFKPLEVVETDVKRRVGCFDKAERDLGWKSKVDLDTALEECLDSFQARYAQSVPGPRLVDQSSPETASRDTNSKVQGRSG